MGPNELSGVAGIAILQELVALKNILTDLFRGEVVDNVALSGLDRVIAVAESEGKVYLRQCAMKFKKSGTRIPLVELQVRRKGSVEGRGRGGEGSLRGERWSDLSRVELRYPVPFPLLNPFQEMGPSCTLTIRRHKAAAKELEKEACKKVRALSHLFPLSLDCSPSSLTRCLSRARPQVKVKKIKNTKVDVLGETYGRVYLPKQEVDEMALRKMKGLKRERREAAEEKQEAKREVSLL